MYTYRACDAMYYQTQAAAEAAADLLTATEEEEGVAYEACPGAIRGWLVVVCTKDDFLGYLSASK